MRQVARVLAAAVVCLTACAAPPDRSASSAGPASPAGSTTTGRELHGEWVLEKIVDNGRVTTVPTSLDVYLIFDKNDEFRGFDGCAYYGGTFERSADGSMKPVDVAATANGCLSLGVPLDAARAEIDTLLFRNRPITVSERDTRLTIAMSGHILTYTPRSAVYAAVSAFRRLSASNGEPNPHHAAYVITTYKRADELLGHNRPLGRAAGQRVYLIVARGAFARHVPQTSRPSIIYAAYNENAALWEWGIRRTAPPLSELGTVVALRLS